MQQTNFSLSDQNAPPAAADQRELLALVKRQNELLESIQKNLSHSMLQEDNQHNSISTRVVDINMSIGAMIGFMLKWLVASIPVAIIIGACWLLLMLVFGGMFAALGR